MTRRGVDKPRQGTVAVLMSRADEPIGKSGGTNTMKIVKVGEHRKG